MDYIPQKITDTLEQNYMPYTMSVIVSRAIPEIDGFKPAHRKILYTMYNMGLLKGDRRKSADVVGQTMKLHPHGDLAIYETMVRMTRGNASFLHPFVDSKGNFGKRYSRDMAFAASRYTEVKLDGICEEIFGDINKNTVDMVDNYDGSMKEPALFPTTFPNVLVTPNVGIAVGMASSVCGFNLREICEATIAFIKNSSIDLTEYISAPDFSTGGQYIYNENEMKGVIETGRGSLKLRAKYRFDKKNSCIDVYEIPYGTTIEAIIDKITLLVKTGKIRDITDVRDETGLEGLKITIDIRKSADPELVMRRLFAATPLTDSFSCNFNILINGKPRTMGVREILREWLIFRISCVRRGLMYDLERYREKLHLLEGLSKILLDIDKAIRIIRQTEDDKQVIPNLCDGFNIDKIQAEFIAEIKLRNLNREYLLTRTDELNNIKDIVKDIEEKLSDDKAINSIIIDELKHVIKKYAKPRMTEIIYVFEDDTSDDESARGSSNENLFIDDYNVRLFLTEHSYFKKITLASLRSSGEQYLKDGDRIIQEFDTTNKNEILFFSDKQNVYKSRIYELPECKASSMGEYLANFLGAEENEKIIYFAVVTDYSGFMFIAFENGKCAKIEMNGYATKTNRKKLINAYSVKSKPVYMDYIKEDRDYAAVRDSDKALLFNTSLINAVGSKNSQGVQVFNLKKNSKLALVLPSESFNSTDVERYRTDKIPSTGHFLAGEDKLVNDVANVQLSL